MLGSLFFSCPLKKRKADSNLLGRGFFLRKGDDTKKAVIKKVLLFFKGHTVVFLPFKGHKKQLLFLLRIGKRKGQQEDFNSRDTGLLKKDQEDSIPKRYGHKKRISLLVFVCAEGIQAGTACIPSAHRKGHYQI